MIKHFCDVCGVEVKRNYVGDRLRRTQGNIGIEVMVCSGGTWNGGDICLACLLDVINNGQDTTRKASKTVEFVIN